MPITALPVPPSRSDAPQDFSDRADALLGALPLFVTEANALQTEVNANEQSALNAAISAANSAAQAQDSATTATTKAGEASASAAAAAASASSASIAFDSFDDKYLGSKASDPTTDNDGDPLIPGAIYWNTTLAANRVWNGGAWQTAINPSDSSAVAFQQSGAGAVGRAAQEKMREFVSVKDFGAAGDGVTDDTTAINLALSVGGRAVFFPHGQYVTTGTLHVSNDTTLFGPGAIRAIALPSGGAGVGQVAISLIGVSGVAIHEITIDLSAITSFTAGVRAIGAIGSSNFRVRGCRIKTPGAAVASIGCSRYEVICNWIEISSTDGLSYHDGIIDQWGGSNTAVISGNNIQGNGIGKYAILVTGQNTDTTPAQVYGYAIANNVVTGVSQVGVWVQGRNGGARNITVTGNVVTSVGLFHGIFISEVSGFTVSGNLVRDTAKTGIRVCSENTSIYSLPTAFGTVSGNTVIGANASASASLQEGCAIYVGDRASTVSVSGNAVGSGGHLYAVLLGGDSANCIVSSGAYSAGTTGTVGNLSSSATNNPTPPSFSPTLVGVANVTEASLSGPLFVTRDGDFVTVTGRVSVTPTASGAATQVGIPLPVASNITATSDASGSASTAFGTVATVYGDATNKRAILAFQANNTTANVFSVTFRYVIL